MQTFYRFRPKKTSENVDKLLLFTDDLLKVILLKIPYSQLLPLRLVSKRFKTIIASFPDWRKLVNKFIATDISPEQDFHSYFQQHYLQVSHIELMFPPKTQSLQSLSHHQKKVKKDRVKYLPKMSPLSPYEIITACIHNDYDILLGRYLTSVLDEIVAQRNQENETVLKIIVENYDSYMCKSIKNKSSLCLIVLDNFANTVQQRHSEINVKLKDLDKRNAFEYELQIGTTVLLERLGKKYITSCEKAFYYLAIAANYNNINAMMIILTIVSEIKDYEPYYLYKLAFKHIQLSLLKILIDHYQPDAIELMRLINNALFFKYRKNYSQFLFSSESINESDKKNIKALYDVVLNNSNFIPTCFDEGENCYLLAVAKLNVSYLETLYELKKVDINTLKDSNGRMAIHYACIEQNSSTIQWLLKNKSEINVPDKLYFRTPLHYLVDQKILQLNLITRLIEEGADINQVDIDGNHILHIAARRGHLKLVELLIHKGLDPNSKNKLAATAYDLVQEVCSSKDATENHIAVLTFLSNRPIQQSPVSNQSDIPLRKLDQILNILGEIKHENQQLRKEIKLLNEKVTLQQQQMDQIYLENQKLRSALCDLKELSPDMVASPQQSSVFPDYKFFNK